MAIATINIVNLSNDCINFFKSKYNIDLKLNSIIKLLNEIYQIYNKNGEFINKSEKDIKLLILSNAKDKILQSIQSQQNQPSQSQQNQPSQSQQNQQSQPSQPQQNHQSQQSQSQQNLPQQLEQQPQIYQNQLINESLDDHLNVESIDNDDFHKKLENLEIYRNLSINNATSNSNIENQYSQILKSNSINNNDIINKINLSQSYNQTPVVIYNTTNNDVKLKKNIFVVKGIERNWSYFLNRNIAMMNIPIPNDVININIDNILLPSDISKNEPFIYIN